MESPQAAAVVERGARYRENGGTTVSSGLPTALAPFSVTGNFSRSVHVIAGVCLVGAALVLLAFQSSAPSASFWPGFAALLPLSIALVLVDRFRDPPFSMLYLIAGAATVYGFTLAVENAADMAVLARVVTVELPKIALVMVGGAGASAGTSLRWCIAGFLTAELAYFGALVQAGRPWRFDPVTAGAFVVVALMLVFAWLNRRRSSRTRPRFTSAAHDELIAALRFRMETRAAALLHDTVLSDLAAVAATSDGRVDTALADRIGRDLDHLADDRWFAPASGEPTGPPESWAGPVLAAIRDARGLGLEIGVTGDTSAVARLRADDAAELARAVTQCLTNVVRHSGTRAAEVAMYGADAELLIMVVDSGRGFDEAASRPDRMGLRTSIRGRVESLGGSVQIWSTLGRGTSVVLRVPIHADPDQRTPVGRTGDDS